MIDRLTLYRAARALLPAGLRDALAGSRLTRGVRDAFFRPGGAPRLVQGPVSWMDLDFQLTAPIQVLERAQRRGVENRICRLIRAYLEPGDLALDVGTNYGFITTVMAHSVGSEGRVLGFEIEPHVLQAVGRTLKANGHAEIVELITSGAGAPGDEDLVTVDGVLEAREARDGFEGRTPRLIKVDVDGGDFDVLVGARRILEAHHPIVIIEMTEHQREIYELLVASGYEHFIDQSNQALESGRSPSGDWPENLIASVDPVRVPLKS